MSSVAEMIKVKTVDTYIDKLGKKVRAIKSQETTNVVTFKADEACRLEFHNPRVFGVQSIFLEKNKPRELTVIEPNQETDWDVYLLESEVTIAMSAQAETLLEKIRPWPILP